MSLSDFSVSKGGAEISLNSTICSSMGFIGGLNSELGAKSKHILELDKDDIEIYFNRADGGYELIWQKIK